MRGKQENKWVWEAIMEIGVDRNCKSSKAWNYHSEIRRQGRRKNYKWNDQEKQSVNEEKYQDKAQQETLNVSHLVPPMSKPLHLEMRNGVNRSHFTTLILLKRGP